MSEARYSSSDIPNFDTSQSALARDDFYTPERSGLEIRAARLGAALGHFVVLLRHRQRIAQQKLSVMAEDATATLNQTAGTAKARAAEVGQVASNKAQELWIEGERRADDLRVRATVNLKRARVRAKEIQRDNPERVVIGAGALGVALGIGLRIWRANRV
jgi:ElaB/YqjD/DUF883 family membrane-anchored ribosome-binding protein